MERDDVGVKVGREDVGWGVGEERHFWCRQREEDAS